MRVIAIETVFEGAGCEDASAGEVPKLDLPLARRVPEGIRRADGHARHRQRAGRAGAVHGLGRRARDAEQVRGRGRHENGRALFPHKKLPDAVYALLAKDIDAKAAGDAGAAKMIRDGIAALNAAAGGNFAKASEKKRKEIVKGMEGQPFFATVRGQCITSLYDNDMAFKVFGYPGSAWEKGGYITRGFQDLKWLPAPSLEASPKPYLG